LNNFWCATTSTATTSTATTSTETTAAPRVHYLKQGLDFDETFFFSKEKMK